MKSLSEYFITSLNENFKSLTEYIEESRADGKYVDLPKKQYKPIHLSAKYQGAEYVKKAKEAWKEYQKSVIDINTENFEILIDKLLSAMKSEEGHDNLIRNAENSKFSSYYYNKETGERDFFDDVEMASRKCRAALETDEIEMSKILKTRQREKRNSWDGPDTIFYGGHNWSQSIYKGLCLIAQVYNVDIPKFEEDFNPLKTASVDDRMQEWVEQKFTRTSDEQWAKHKAKEAETYKKDVEKLKKVRAAFKKSDTYKKLMEILDQVDKDLKHADEKFKSWDEIFNKQMDDKKHAEDLKKAIEEIKDDVNNVLADSFSHPEDISWGVNKLYVAAAEAYLKTGKHPEIKRLSRDTGSWLSGMHVTCKFEVIASDDTSYGVFTFQDHGLDGPDGRPVSGFGPYD